MSGNSRRLPDGELLSRGFDAGNYDSVYVSEDYMVAFSRRSAGEPLSAHDAWCTGYVLGFFSSWELHEVPQDLQEMVTVARTRRDDVGKLAHKMGLVE